MGKFQCQFFFSPSCLQDVVFEVKVNEFQFAHRLITAESIFGVLILAGIEHHKRNEL